MTHLPKNDLPGAVRPTLTPLGDCLRRPRLSRLMKQAGELARINEILRELLPPSLHGHAALARLGPDAWTIQADSPAWATRLRYSLPRLRKRLAERLGSEVPALRVRISQPEVAEPAPPPRRLHMPDTAAELIEGTAQGISDPNLSAALLRLARHGRRNMG